MKSRMLAGLVALATMLAWGSPVAAQWHQSVQSVNCQLHGTLLDFTHNGLQDRRIYSAALCECRDLYVYLPPGYDPTGRYPLLVWLHSYSNDEREFVQHVVPIIDQAVGCGKLPPLVVAAPDGSLTGNAHTVPLGSWYVNSRRGRFADYIVQDVLDFVEANFGVCRDPSGRAIAGFSMGGFGAYNLGMKHSDKFRLVAGIAPTLNLRYCSKECGYFGDYEPGGWCYRDDYASHEVVGRFYGGLLKVRAWHVIRPVWGRGPEAVQRVGLENPIELLDRLQVQPGRQEYYAAYGKSDELNVDAQVESFLEVANSRGIQVEHPCYPCGDHSLAFVRRALPELLAWLNGRLACLPSQSPAPATASSMTGAE
jgi:S-formylglutathione hydrolase FrmB